MDQSLKQRLVGALVLLSLAVIFLPLVFDGQQQRVDSSDYDYPDQPAMTIQSLDFTSLEQTADGAVDAVSAIETAKLEQENSTADSSATPAGPASDFEPEGDPVADYLQQERAADQAIQQSSENAVSLADAWVLQVGAFSSRSNADGLRDRLIASGYKAYTKQISGLFKVYVGPEIRRTRLEQQKSALEQDFKLKALILKYIP